MSNPVLYGESESEKRAEENNVCRQMVREINNFGISQRQALFLIYLLASELENIEQMKSITNLVRELGGDDLFISGRPEPDHEITGGNNGPSNA